MGEMIRQLFYYPLTVYRERKYSEYEQLRQWQWESREKIIRLQKEKLAKLLRHSYKNVPYYRELLSEHGVVQKDTVHIDRFTSLPTLDKPTLQARFDDLQSHDLDNQDWYENSTGGSTGEPVTFLQNKQYDRWNIAIKKIFNDWTEYRNIGPEIKLWGSEDDILSEGKNDLGMPSSFREKVSLYFGSPHLQNAFRMTEEDMYEYVAEINEIEPIQIRAYTESIFQLAQFINRKKLSVHSPNSIWVTAGTLHDPMRKTIEKTFNSEVFNQYGSREAGAIACECEEHHGLHISAPTHYVEIVDSDGRPVDPGETGEIVVTVLTNYAMPLIRYRIGDMAIKSEDKCECGRGFPVLEEITGRVSDVFVTKDGTRVHGEYFTHLFYFRSWIRKFQVVQEGYNRIHIKIVSHDGKCDGIHVKYRSDLEDITGKIQTVMGDECEVEYELVNDIPPTDSGKYRFTISKVHSK